MGPHPPTGSYIVLGAGGMMGTHALMALRDVPGIDVVAVYHQRAPRVRADNIRYLQADLRDPSACREVIDQADVMLHFAGVLATAPVLARDPVGPVTDNLRIAANGLEAAWLAGVGKCLWLGTTLGYPLRDGPLVEDEMFDGEPPEGWYGMGWMGRYVESFAKLLAERLPQGMQVSVLRPSLIYGEFDHFDEATAHFLPSMIRRVVDREAPIEVWGSGEQTRDVVHAEDVLRCAWAALARDATYGAYNVCAGESHSVNHILGRIIALDGYADAEVRHVGDKPQSAARREFSPARARAELAFTPEIDLDAGLARTIAWYRESLAEHAPTAVGGER